MPNFFINVKERGAKAAGKSIGSLTGSLKRLALQAVGVAAVMQGLRKSIQMSAEMEGVKRGFDNLAKSSGFTTGAFNKFKSATDNTIDSLTLMKKANAAMLLGITDSEDQMASMFDVAQRLGQSLGIDTVQSIDSLVTGMGRQCLTSDSFISTKNGMKQIIDIKEGDIVLSYQDDKIIETEVTHLHNNGIQPIYIVTFKDGKYIKSTDNHRYLTDNGWKYLSELDSGSKILNIDNEYSEIHSINSFGEEDVYDLTVPETANFFANGLCVHNSKLMLDNLGIMVDTNKSYKDFAEANNISVSAMTDTQRKQAFVNAAMKEANFLVSQLGEEQLTTKDKIAQMNNAFADLAVTMGDTIAPIITQVALGVAGLIEGLAELGMTPLEKMVKSLQELGADAGLVKALQVDVANEKISNLESQLGRFNEKQIRASIELSKQKTEQTLGDIAYWEQENMLTDDLTKKAQEWLDEDQKSLEAGLRQLEIINQIKALQSEIVELKKEETEPEDKKEVVIKKTKEELEAELKLAAQRKQASKDFVSNMQNMAKAPGWEGMENAAKRAAQVQALVDAYAGANAAFKAMAGIPVIGPALGATAYVAALTSGLASVKQIEAAQFGMDQVVSQPTLIMAGEAGAEQVSITPLEGPNLEGPQGSSVTVNVSGNVLSDTFVEEELAEKIREGIRRGVDFGIS
ncbi:hypothetical protein CMI37_34640 [Candidatus Pacearchaeota archaeon]|nr:hypothetical protein [Candidatus Pacearchaeota archaeon]